MQRIEIELTGSEEARRVLRRLQTVELLRPPMVRGLARLQARISPYPPPPPDSTYRRTGTLGRTWTAAEIEVTRGEIRGVFGNGTEYGPYVQDEEYQAEVHRGRWMTDVQAVAEEEGAIVHDFEITIRALVG